MPLDLRAAAPAALALRSAASGDLVVPELHVACTFFSRLVGLQFRRQLPAGQGLLLLPCASIHTCFMRFAIDAVMLDGAGTVLRVVRNIRPWSGAFAPRGTRAVLELSPAPATLAAGDQLRLVVRRDLPDRLMRRLSCLPTDHLAPSPTSKGAS